MDRRTFEVGEEVKLWVGLVLAGYPQYGVIKQYIPEYPFRPTYEVEFPEGSKPASACLLPEWLFPMSPKGDSAS